jgi:hypothetical protein
MIRPLLALPVIVYLWKVIVWDKVLGWGTTDAIAGNDGLTDRAGLTRTFCVCNQLTNARRH